MDGKHPNQYDKRPKRRKDKDNPYELLSVGMDTPTARYYIRFKDGQGVEHCMEIEKPLFDMLDGFELEDISHLNEVDNHYEINKIEHNTRYKGLKQEKINFDVLGALTWNEVGLYCRYSPGKFFKEGYGPEIKNTWTLGVTIGL